MIIAINKPQSARPENRGNQASWGKGSVPGETIPLGISPGSGSSLIFLFKNMLKSSMESSYYRLLSFILIRGEVKTRKELMVR